MSVPFGSVSRGRERDYGRWILPRQGMIIPFSHFHLCGRVCRQCLSLVTQFCVCVCILQFSRYPSIVRIHVCVPGFVVVYLCMVWSVTESRLHPVEKISTLDRPKHKFHPSFNLRNLRFA